MLFLRYAQTLTDWVKAVTSKREEKGTQSTLFENIQEIVNKKGKLSVETEWLKGSKKRNFPCHESVESKLEMI